MTEFEDLHPVLRRQLRRSGITTIDALPELAAWQAAVDRISTVYEETSQTEQLTERALDLASAEMQQLYRNLEQRVAERTRQIVAARADLESTNEALASSNEELATGERLFRMTVDGAPQGVAVNGLDLRFLKVNPALCSMLGRDETWLLAHSIRDIVFSEDLRACLADKDSLLSGACQKAVHEGRWLRADGSTLWVIHSTALMRDERNNPMFFVSHVQDNAEAHERSVDLAYRANHDPLTGLMNRDQLQERITGVLDRESRRGGTTAILFCDIDHFAGINDTYGHDAGDQLLKTAAERLAESVRSADVVTRIGGDEFVVVLAEVYDLSAAIAVAEKIRTALSNPVLIDKEHLITTTISVGVAVASRNIDAHRLLRNADAALYEAKNAGRNRVAAFHEVSTSGADRDIRRGLDCGQFVPWFQPIVNLSDGVLVGYEALVRWVHPDGRITGPNGFLPVAERTELVKDLDRAVLARTVEMLGNLPEPLHIAVNVSAATLMTRAYVDQVIADLARHGVDPNRLHLEFTETALLSVTTGVHNAMSELADLGARWYVDDFGTGYSSISHLRDLPVSGLKLDVSFTQGIGREDPTCENLAQALAGLADGLGLDTVAEGIETPRQAAILTAQGWKHGQGWLYGHPAPVPEPPATKVLGE